MNRVSKGVAMWVLPSFMKKLSAAWLTIRLTPSKGDNALSLVDRGQEEQERLFTYVDAVNYLLSSHATDDVISESIH